MAEEEASEKSSIFQVEPSELVKAAIATALVFIVRVLLDVFRLVPQVPESLKGILTPDQLTNAIAGALWFGKTLPAFRYEARQMIIAQAVAGGEPSEEMTARLGR